MTGGDLVSLEDVREAADRLEGVAIPTPTLPSAELSDALDGEVRVKCESLQRAGAFKIRGAYNFVSRLPREALDRGVTTYSSGNHAQAVALAAGIMGARSVVVMPTTAPEVKRRGARRLGAEVVLEGTTSLERRARAEEIAEAEGLTIVPPFDDPRIIAGQGTVGLEIHEAWPDVQAVLVPVGGGGLLSGIAAALRRLRPGVVILGVEPRGAASMRLALDQGRPVPLDTIETIADGLAPVRAGELTFEHVRDLVDDVVTVDDDAI
ncbi:MAG TPA: threonine/serine dehydratase, partial [Longimicrobiales bacterium]|nr:threonine/serine dehydratase [Longimicrobiales bacterium]